jgi:phage-related tail protein
VLSVRLVKPPGYGEDLAVFSNDFTTLATDLASFNNTSPEEAVQAIGAALRGEAEPLRRFGVLLNDATLKQEALTLGIYDGKGALTAQQKILAAQAAIYKQTTDAQGDFLRTSEGLANSQRTLSAEFANLQAQLGQKLLPLMEEFTRSLLDITDWVRRNPKTFGFIGDSLGRIATQALKATNSLYPFIFNLTKLVGNTVEADKATGAYNENLGRSSAAHIRAVDAAHEFNKSLKTTKEETGGAAKKINELYDVINDKLKDALDEAKKQFRGRTRRVYRFWRQRSRGN